MDFKKTITIVYALVIVLFIGLSCHALATSDKENTRQLLNEDTRDISQGWTDRNGAPVDIGQLQELAYDREESVFYTLPEEIDPQETLVFFAHHIFYSVYVDGSLVYEEEVPEHALYNKGPGHCWCFIPLQQEYEGKQLEVRFTCAYPEKECYISNCVIGSEHGILLQIIHERLVSFVASLLLLFLGVIFVIADFPINIRNEKNHELLYLGLIAICVSVWTIMEMQLIQLFTGNSRLTHVVSYMALMLMSMPTVLYADEAMQNKNNLVTKIICGLSITQYMICLGLNLAGILDFKETLWSSHVFIGISAAYILIAIVRSLYKQDRNSNWSFKLLRLIGITTFVFSALIDLVRYYLFYGSDSAMFVRVGLLIFVLCYGCASLEKTIDMVKMGAQADLIKKLAYQDGLTGVGNRTAFQEKLEAIEESAKSGEAIKAGVVVFDVNDLKKTNDKFGHQAGDNMIVDCANIISKAFESVGKVYRIGGDEFAAVLVGDDAKAKTERAIDVFEYQMKEFREQSQTEYALKIAKGCAFYDSTVEEGTLEDAYKTADEKMYENKKQLKEAVRK